MRRLLAGAVAAMLLAGCGGEVGVPITAPEPGSAGTCQARGYHAPAVLFLAKETVPEELDGLTFFAENWGRRQGCFRGTVVSAAIGDIRGYDDLVVDVAHDATLGAKDVALVHAFLAAGRRVAVFAWPIRLSEDTVADAALAGVPALFGDVLLTRVRGCGDWLYTAAPGSPFQLGGTSYRYENFGASIFTVATQAPHRIWASTLFCPADTGAVMVEVPQGIVAGFSIAYTISLADNNVRSVAMKRLLVDVINELAGASPAIT